MPFSTRNIQASQRKKALKDAVKKIGAKSASAFKKVLPAKSTEDLSAGEQINNPRPFAARGLGRGNSKKKRKNWWLGAALITFGFLVVAHTTLRGLGFFQNFQLSDVLWLAGSDLPTDENGFTNILLLGVGGKGHQGESLTDTIMVASIDQTTKTAVLLSIPRDFYLETEETNSRINEVVRDVMSQYPRNQQETLGYEQGVEKLEAEIEDFTGLKIQRFLQVDFQGFTKGVDALGGVDVTLENEIDDYEYPDGEWGYEHFFLPAGRQHVDGATALKVARSRHGSSDFERAMRQRQILEAIKEKAVSLKVLTSPGKLRELYDILVSHLRTDLDWQEMIALAEVGAKFSKDHIFSFGFNNDETKPGGFLVAPARELYGGASVLVPFLNLEKGQKYAQLRAFADVIFHERALLNGEVQVQVLNGTKTSGKAGVAATHLERFGIPVSGVENSSEELAATEIRFEDTPQNRQIANLLLQYIDATLHPHAVSSDKNRMPSSVVTVVIGSAHENYRIPLERNPFFPVN